MIGCDNILWNFRSLGVLIGEFELRLFTLLRLLDNGVVPFCGVAVNELVFELGVGSLSGPEIFNSSKLPLNEVDFWLQELASSDATRGTHLCWCSFFLCVSSNAIVCTFRERIGIVNRIGAVCVDRVNYKFHVIIIELAKAIFSWK